MSMIDIQPLSRLNIFSLKGVQMKTFHITWLTFFFCFFAWFGIAPLMPLVSEELHLTKMQKGNVAIAAVSATIIARLIVGRLTDRFGPRIVYTWLLVLCSFPVMCIGLANNYTSFLLFRLGIGVIGASFVLTQFHTSVMFASNIKGNANAVAGGLGNTGGGTKQLIIPLIVVVDAGCKAPSKSFASLAPIGLFYRPRRTFDPFPLCCASLRHQQVSSLNNKLLITAANQAVVRHSDGNLD